MEGGEGATKREIEIPSSEPLNSTEHQKKEGRNDTEKEAIERRALKCKA